MDPVGFNDYLDKRYFDQINYYENVADRNQRRYKNFQWILIILSTLTTIMAALPKNEIFDAQWLIVVSAATVTVLTAGLKTFQYQELWANYRSTIEQLKPEIYYYNFNIGDYGKAGVDKEKTFVSRVEKILNKEHAGWPVIKELQEQEVPKEHPNNSSEKTPDELQRDKLNAQKNTVTNKSAAETTVSEQKENTLTHASQPHITESKN